MKLILILLLFLFVFKTGYSQNNSGLSDNEYFKIIKGSSNSGFYRTTLSSDIDTTWNKWKQKGYHFGFDPKFTPMYTTIDGILSTP